MSTELLRGPLRLDVCHRRTDESVTRAWPCSRSASKNCQTRTCGAWPGAIETGGILAFDYYLCALRHSEASSSNAMEMSTS